MATSFITKDGTHGFWISDAFVQIISWGFLQVIDDSTLDIPQWMKEKYRDYLYHSSLGHFMGFSDLDLEKYLKLPDGINQYNWLIEKTKSLFANKGDLISVEEINGFQTDESTRSSWTEPFETKRAIKVLDFVGDVVNDRILIKVDDRIDYSF